ncbi:MAG: DNA-binding protein [Elusimicrobia bacterium]|nr:DNA-binding protein [Elusimicrobiota bacterium]
MPEDKPYLTGRTYIFRLSKGDDIISALQSFCHNNQLKCGIITAIGAVSKLTFAFYDKKKKKYNKMIVQQDLEILNLTGSISIMDDKPMVHVHITVSGEDGKAFGGHLMAGTEVFACEVFVQELVGAPKIRKPDKETGLPLWINAR